MATLPTVTLPKAYWSDRGPFLAGLYATHGPLIQARLGRTEVVFLLGPHANRFVLQSHRHAFSHRQGWSWAFGKDTDPRNLLTMDGTEHAHHRGILHPAFAARRMDDYLSRLVLIIDRRLATWTARRIVDVYEEARVIALDVVAELLLGIRPGAELNLCRAVFLHGAHARAVEFAALLRALTAARRAYPRDDALGLLARATDTEGHLLTHEQILGHAETLLIAGHETTASLAAWSLYLLASHPAYERRLLHELALHPPAHLTLHDMPVLSRVLNEAERLYPPIPNAPRGLLRDVQFDHQLLPAGTMVLYSAAATHLLPNIWTDPTSFDPDRFAPPREEHRATPYALVGFGAGPRVCIGRTLARVELGLLLARAVQRYRLSLVPGQTLVQRYGVTNRPLRGIRLHAQPRLPIDP